MRLREMLDVYRGYRIPRFQLIEHKRRWFVFSGILIALSIIGLVFIRMTFSIDFKGGAQISYPADPATKPTEVLAIVRDHGLDGEVQLVQTSTGTEIAIRTSSLSDSPKGQDLRKALADQAGISVDEINVEDIGPTWGTRISQQALLSLLIALACIAAYIALRFEATMAVGALVALVHDVLITAGIYALTGREVTPETVIAVLTILGFSLYDTVVIYDKIKENTESPAMVARLGYDGVVDLSLNQTIMRSVNTSLVVLLPILSLLLFGGDTLKDFAFAMFIGVAIGAYSSIFIAAPVLTILHRRRAPAVATSRPRPVGVSATVAATSDAAATAATAKVSVGPSRPAPKSKRRPPAKRKRR